MWLFHRPSKAHHVYHMVITNQSGDTIILGSIYCKGNLTAPNIYIYIYANTEVNIARAPQASTPYVDSQLALESNHDTTYTIYQVNTTLCLKSNQATTGTMAQADHALAPQVTTCK